MKDTVEADDFDGEAARLSAAVDAAADDFDDEDSDDEFGNICDEFDINPSELFDAVSTDDELDAYDLVPDALESFDARGDFRRGGFMKKLGKAVGIRGRRRKKKKGAVAPRATGPRVKAIKAAVQLEVQGIKPPRAIPWLVQCVSKQQTFSGQTGIFTVTQVRRIVYKATRDLLDACRIVAQGSVAKAIVNAVCPAAGADFNILGSVIPAFGYRLVVSNAMLNVRGGAIRATIQYWNTGQVGPVAGWVNPNRAYEIYLGGHGDQPDWEVFILAFDNNAGIGEVARTESARLLITDADATNSPIIRAGGALAPTVFQLEPINLYDLTDRYRK